MYFQLSPLKRSKQLKEKASIYHAMLCHLDTTQSTWFSGSNRDLDTPFTGKNKTVGSFEPSKVSSPTTSSLTTSNLNANLGNKLWLIYFLDYQGLERNPTPIHFDS